MASSRTIFVTHRDLERLTRLFEIHGSRRDAEAVTELEEELGHAKVVESAQIPPDVVTMNSRVRFEDLDTGDQLEVTLAYPKDADVDQGKISVLAPVGSALLGLSVGQSIRWPLPGGKSRHLRVVSVTYQPEAAGDLDL
ncbi:MAG TPA: nucleoside diphosphate kinase regulator [Candidatus Binatia bacterium]|nr:nucleoside diphosphate kinase regulator [Candidatus Binatia bacterium]